ncbi:MAG: hypothetical protein ACC645_22210 [Pirellulales bacterium]
MGKIKRMFKWGASEELVSGEVFHAFQTVGGLRKGYTEAREPEPVRPDADVEAALPFLPPVVADMVRIQRLTVARPTETASSARTI